MRRLAQSDKGPGSVGDMEIKRIDVLQSTASSWQEFVAINRGAMNAALNGWKYDEKEPETLTDENGRPVWSFNLVNTRG